MLPVFDAHDIRLGEIQWFWDFLGRRVLAGRDYVVSIGDGP